MATKKELKAYVALWMQLGKTLEYKEKTMLCPDIRNIYGYTKEYDDFWEDVWKKKDYVYLSYVNQSLGELNKEEWSLDFCAYCQMPSPLKVLGVTTDSCICGDLYLHPNKNLPLPRIPNISECKLMKLVNKLSSKYD